MPEFIQMALRSVAAFIILLFMTRLMGKKQISQLTFFDYVVGISIGSIAAAISFDRTLPILNGLASLLVWSLFPILLGYLTMKSYKIRMIIEGSPSVLIKNGKVHEENLVKNRLTIDELMLLLRQKNAFKLADVEFAVLETDGNLSVLKKSDSKPIMPKDINLFKINEREPRIILMDGHVMEKTLDELGYSKEWLKDEIRKKGVNDFRDIFLAQIDGNGNIYIDLYKDGSPSGGQD